MAGFLQTGNKAACTACGACLQRCPHDAIRMKEDEFGFVFPEVDSGRCVHCGLCEKVCPVDNPAIRFHPGSEGTAVAGFAKDATLRAASSSGGFFTGVVRAFWKDGETVVFGAEMQPDLTVAHTRADTLDGIAKFRTSKYARSDTRNTFAEAKTLLSQGKRVIYSGTPCQIAGLLSFLGGEEEPENLLTVDLVCHGYFSPLFLRKERAYLERKHHSKAIGYEYRNKDGGHWRDFRAVWRFANGSAVETENASLPYLKIWMKHLFSRDSCHACRFAFPDRVSDISLADYWHVPNESPLFGGNYGTSSVFVNTPKGRTIISVLFQSGTYAMGFIDRDRLCAEKASLHGPPTADPRRIEALSDLTRMSYRRYCRKWMPKPKRRSLVRRMAGRILRSLRNISKGI